MNPFMEVMFRGRGGFALFAHGRLARVLVEADFNTSDEFVTVVDNSRDQHLLRRLQTALFPAGAPHVWSRGAETREVQRAKNARRVCGRPALDLEKVAFELRSVEGEFQN
jgi:hypothetical protein